MPKAKSARSTPVMKQFFAAKNAHPGCILFFRMGDFYEMFDDDAVTAAKALDIALTSRSRGQIEEIPMAGVPHHSAHNYIRRLLDLGHKVAICEQMADPSKVKGIVPREVVRVLTPGLVTDAEQLEASANNWLAAIEISERAAAVALLDLSTGELRAADVDNLTVLLGELARSCPREVIVGGAGADQSVLDAVRGSLGAAAVRRDGDVADSDIESALAGFAADAARFGAASRSAAGRALRFAGECTPGVELPVRRIGTWDPAASLIMDGVAQSHLELLTSMTGDRDATLVAVLDSTQTPAGARLLRRRITAPETDVERIRRRLDIVELFTVHPALRSTLRSHLADVGDLERRSVRAVLGEATPRDLGALRDGLLAGARAVAALDAVDDSEARGVVGLPAEKLAVDVVADVAEQLDRALVDRPPTHAKDGAIFRPEFDEELREQAELKKGGTERIVALEARLKSETGIPTTKVRFTRAFGWYVEVSKGHAGKAPSSWRRKQTLTNGERFTTDELDDLAEAIAAAEDRHRDRELALLKELVDVVASASGRIAALASRLARWDVAASLAEIAHRYDYARPLVDDSEVIEIRDGRHPVVERLAAAGRFVPNDVTLDRNAERLWIVTGPNMAGKSTLLRQVALTAILAQMGSYVPASSARIGIVDRVLSRVGAGDNLARGESTFMVEMRETAQILREATPRSLVILDEIGRGTSTYDGLAIAWAVAEHLDAAIACRAMFATHYHELTAMAEASAHVANYSVTAREMDDDIVFLHRLVRGAASRSYGVAVAKLAGLPESVVGRSRALLDGFEKGGASVEPGAPAKARHTSSQLGLFEKPSGPAGHAEIVDTIAALDVDRLTPIDALSLLVKLKKKL